ncbi:MAG: AraC family transcriptional regulator [Pseudomonadota bacterium]
MVFHKTDPNDERRRKGRAIAAEAFETAGGVRRRESAGVSVALDQATLRLLPAAAYEARFTPAAPMIGFAYDLQEGAHAFASDRLRPFLTRPNSVAFTPAGCDVASLSRRGGEYLVLELTGAPAREASEQFTDRASPAAAAAALRLRRLLLAAAPIDRLELEESAAALREAALSPTFDLVRAEALTPRRLRRLDAFIEAALGEALTVERIAAEMELSSGYLTRALKAAIGMTPHAYLLERRLARARRWITGSTAPLAEIAAECGFASQAHMTTQMRRRLGATPAQLRRC